MIDMSHLALAAHHSDVVANDVLLTCCCVVMVCIWQPIIPAYMLNVI